MTIVTRKIASALLNIRSTGDRKAWPSTNPPQVAHQYRMTSQPAEASPKGSAVSETLQHTPCPASPELPLFSGVFRPDGAGGRTRVLCRRVHVARHDPPQSPDRHDITPDRRCG